MGAVYEQTVMSPPDAYVTLLNQTALERHVVQAPGGHGAKIAKEMILTSTRVARAHEQVANMKS